MSCPEAMIKNYIKKMILKKKYEFIFEETQAKNQMCF